MEVELTHMTWIALAAALTGWSKPRAKEVLQAIILSTKWMRNRERSPTPMSVGMPVSSSSISIAYTDGG